MRTPLRTLSASEEMRIFGAALQPVLAGALGVGRDRAWPGPAADLADNPEPPRRWHIGRDPDAEAAVRPWRTALI